MNRLMTGSTVYIQFNYLNRFKQVYCTATNFSSPALTLAYAVHSSLLSNICSLLKESWENLEHWVRILKFHGETIVSLHYKLPSGYASGEWLTNYTWVYIVTQIISNLSPVHCSSFTGHLETHKPFGQNSVSTNNKQWNGYWVAH